MILCGSKKKKEFSLESRELSFLCFYVFKKHHIFYCGYSLGSS
jgi:hypothetical protein